MNIYEIFITFFKMGIMLLGGGYVILPVARNELVEKKKWLTQEQVCEFYTLARSMPGIVAVNFSVFAGYSLNAARDTATGIVRLAVWQERNALADAAAALFGLVTPAFVSIIVLAKIFEAVIHLKFIQSMFFGIGIGVVMLIFLSVQEIWRVNNEQNKRFWFILFFAAFVLSVGFGLSPALIVPAAVALGVFLARRNAPERAPGQEEPE